MMKLGKFTYDDEMPIGGSRKSRHSDLSSRGRLKLPMYSLKAIHDTKINGCRTKTADRDFSGSPKTPLCKKYSSDVSQRLQTKRHNIR
jgi:hypothetical protein